VLDVCNILRFTNLFEMVFAAKSISVTNGITVKNNSLDLIERLLMTLEGRKVLSQQKRSLCFILVHSA
jgi:hypothetical protein